MTGQTRPGRPYAGQDDSSRRASRRQRLLTAAYELFGDATGPSSATVESICSRASVATRSIYEEFGGRDQLVVALCEDIHAQALATVDAALGRATEEDRIGAAVGAYVEFVTAEPRRARVLHLLKPLGAAALVERIDPHAERLFLIALTGAVNAVMSDWARTTPSPPAGPVIDGLTNVLTRLLSADPASRVSRAS